MKVVFVLSRLFDDTRDFVRRLAGRADTLVQLLQGDADPAAAMETIGSADRLWFEGAGPLLLHCVEQSKDRWLPPAAVRATAQEFAALPFPDAWRLVSDVVVPNPTDDQAIRSLPTPPGRQRVHVVDERPTPILGARLDPLERLNRLAEILGRPFRGQPLWMWQKIISAADGCQGDVLVLGEPPEELLDYLRICLACRTFDSFRDLPSQQAHAVMHWDNLTAAQAPRLLAEAVRRLRPGGLLVATTKPDPAAGEPSSQVIAELLSGLCEGADCLTTEGLVARVRLGGKDGPAQETVETSFQPPLVTAVVPAHNRLNSIDRALWSLRRQTYRNLDILVVDDGSTDGTRQAVEKHLNDSRVRYLYTEHCGTPEARNFGIRHSRGDHILWLGSDDEALPNRAMACVEAAMESSADLVYTDVLYVSELDGKLMAHTRYSSFQPQDLPALLLQRCAMLDGTTLVRKRLYELVGLYDGGFPRGQDYDLFVRCSMTAGLTYRHVPAALTKVYRKSMDRTELAETELAIYHRLARKLISFFGQQRLMDAKARHLHQVPELHLARVLMDKVIERRAPLDHPIMQDAYGYLQRALNNPLPAVQAGAVNLLGVLAKYGGDVNAARTRFQQALRLWPELADARRNLKELDEAARKEAVSDKPLVAST